MISFFAYDTSEIFIRITYTTTLYEHLLKKDVSKKLFQQNLSLLQKQHRLKRLQMNGDQKTLLHEVCTPHVFSN